MNNNNDVLDRVLRDIKSVSPVATTSHSSYVMGVFESDPTDQCVNDKKDVLDRVLGEIKAVSAASTTSHGTYVMGVFEKSDE